MNPLLERFHAEKNAFNRIKKVCESKVVRWEYWDWPRWYWDPDFFLSARQNANRVKKEKAKFGLGYDKENRVVVIHWVGGIGRRDGLHSMQFLRWSAKKVVGSEFHGKTVYEGDTVARTDFRLSGNVSDCLFPIVSKQLIQKEGL
jgi:hypothetical protein